MSASIWWFGVRPAEGWQKINMPLGSRPVHLGGDRLWAVVPDIEDPPVPHYVAVIGTGWTVPEGARHIHTDVRPNGLVWHLFIPEENT